jgi:PPOX class probable F420-dependent enzyme
MGSDHRSRAALDDDALSDLLATTHESVLATIGRDGQPHLMAMWFLAESNCRILMWTYAASQKTVNLRRDPRATILVVAGDAYDELRGASLDCEVEIIEDDDQVAAIGARLVARYGAPVTDEVIRHQARGRVGLVLSPKRVRTWDHAKLRAPR